MFGKLLTKWNKYREIKKWEKKITCNFKDLEHRRKLTSAQKKEVQDFYKSMIGKEIPLYCREYFYSRTGHFTKEYVPNNVYHCELVPKANQHRLQGAFGDKNMCDFLFPGENIVHSILKNMNGYYYFGSKAVTEEDAIEKCSNLGKVIIKPSTLSRGRGVQILNLKNGVNEKSGESLSKLFDGYRTDFLIGEVVAQHEKMAALNPSSINTIRILTYRKGMDVKAVYTVIRIGRKGQAIDNESAGGISTRINPDGRLAKYAFGAPSDDYVEYTDSGVKLENYEIPNFEEAVTLAKKLHLYLPFFNIVGWDMAITPNGSPIMIEFNVNPDLSQSANGPAFGNATEEIVKEAMMKKNTWSKLTTECLYKGI